MGEQEKQSRFAVCIRNGGCEDLELGKVYEILPDRNAESKDCLRVIDESGEDYLYPEAFFLPLALSRSAERTLRILAKSEVPA